MKKTFIAIVTLLSFWGTGCQSTSMIANQSRVNTSATLAAYIGTTEVLRAHPEYRKGFLLAVEELKVLEVGNIDAIKLVEIINRLPVKELKSERASMIITSATIILSDQIGNTPIEKLNDLKPVVAAIRDGIERGLN